MGKGKYVVTYWTRHIAQHFNSKREIRQWAEGRDGVMIERIEENKEGR